MSKLDANNQLSFNCYTQPLLNIVFPEASHKLQKNQIGISNLDHIKRFLIL